MSREYSDWETDDVITEELFRNLGKHHVFEEKTRHIGANYEID